MKKTKVAEHSVVGKKMHKTKVAEHSVVGKKMYKTDHGVFGDHNGYHA